MDVNHQDINTSVENDKKVVMSGSRRSKSGSGHRHHRQKTSFFKRLKRKLFRKKERISGVRRSRVAAENKMMCGMFIGAVILLIILIPLITWVADMITKSAP